MKCILVDMEYIHCVLFIDKVEQAKKSTEKRKGISLSRSPRSTGPAPIKVEMSAKNSVPLTSGVTIVKPEPRVLQTAGRDSHNHKSPRKGRSPKNCSQASKSLFSRDKIQRTGEKSAFVGKSKFEPVVKPVVTGPSAIGIGSSSSSFQPVTARASSSTVNSGSVSVVTTVSGIKPVNCGSAASADLVRSKGLWSVTPAREETSVPRNTVQERPRAGEKRLSSESLDELAPKKIKSVNGR